MNVLNSQVHVSNHTSLPWQKAYEEACVGSNSYYSLTYVFGKSKCAASIKQQFLSEIESFMHFSSAAK